jgi:GntR family transcriptional regulator, vanillate catabolism transcriptional regulator
VHPLQDDRIAVLAEVESAHWVHGVLSLHLRRGRVRLRRRQQVQVLRQQAHGDREVHGIVVVEAEDGAPRQLLRELHECLEEGDRAVNKPVMELDHYAAYVQMNDRFHSVIMRGCSNIALQRVMEMLDRQPFASPSAMLPMQSSMEEGHQWMRIAHLSHHAMVQAIERGQGSRAQALGEEHVEIARMNLDYALARPELAAELMPGMRLVAGKRGV